MRSPLTTLVIPPRDPVALAAAVTRLLDDAPLRVRLGAAGRERVARLFSRERMLADVADVYSAAPTGPDP